MAGIFSYFLRFLICLLGIFLFSACDFLGSDTPEIPNNLKEAPFSEQVEFLVPRLLKDHQIPGAVVAVMESGNISLLKGFGFADVGQGKVMTAEHVFNAASISKAVTAWGVLRLVEQGQIDLDSPVNQYLKRWTLADGNWPASEVTVRRLLSHSGGISMPSTPGFRWPQKAPNLVDLLSGNYQKSAYSRAGSSVKIIYEPGRAFHYSGGGFMILQLLIEDVTGLSFADFMVREVLHPLGMEESQFGWDETLSEKMAIPYLPRGQPEDIFRTPGLAASSLHTTAGDLSKWMLAGALSNRELRSQVLSDAALALMYTPVGETRFGNAELGEIGLAYFIERGSDGEDFAVSHSGDNAGWKARVLFAPGKGHGFVVLVNSDNGDKLIRSLSCLWAQSQPNLVISKKC